MSEADVQPGAPEHEPASTDSGYEFTPLSDEAVKKQLETDATWAAELITKLCTTGGDDAMKPGIVNACEGLAFVRVAKGGLGVTLARGSGFVIRKLDQDRFGHSRWSAPVFYTVSQLGLGLAAGYESVESVLALMTPTSVHRFTEEHQVVGTDLGLVTTDGAMSGVPAGTFGTSNHMDVQANNANAVFAYSLAHGLLANVSINGTSTYPDTALNAKLYGEMPLKDVLAGKLPTFKEFLPLYRRISDTGTSALA
ncbi:hypothetical protein HYH03_001817 [Edaphochlamys debaryana]|uniref:Ysc84 actin-binding domain-containing protein n=1 Tax=Edaphochlamys debaryana TaxID=47281 RepID=A0A835YM66_9CHLO|nr:hypothetical protein HYH03_001817 [Edaphochlamys debaryana]|eukprot:KAG2500239.1 hypothetical protein HYH03_001817 [Edaphochlamys debaryana]